MVTKSSRLRGTVLLLISATVFGLMPVLTKLAYDRGMSVTQLLPVRFLLAAAGLAIVVGILERGRLRLTREQFTGAVALGVLFALQTGAFLVALQTIRASVAVLLLFTFPMMVAVAGWVFLGRPVVARTVLALGLGFFGLFLAVGQLTAGSWTGMALALASAVLNAAYFLFAENELNTAPTLVVCVIGLMVTAIVYTVGVLVIGGKAVPDGSTEWAIVVALACVPLIGLPTLLIGVLELGAVSGAAISAWEPVVSIAAAVGVLSEPFSPVQVCGAVLVVAAVVLAQLEAPAPRM
ncbi:hypothetical protein MMUR_28560 [Mycolicibacterium murale]|uniref:EamA domain-containing protein n=1 Tax=Mycolicibacterium murale TaxID=182220 RepID=A0A7I9WN10_9MYCO|nr:DMT family transporter [Mycolicibacterium murale]MCV7180411.1 DMT family transporter [Mycolicibacterium murale]GFG58720.1 hypothetical protein MMUR_28560 [Mycolicibacterium murale]